MTLQNLWFVILAVLFLGFFVLEGFDFGVGMLMEFFGRTDSAVKGDPEQHRRAAVADATDRAKLHHARADRPALSRPAAWPAKAGNAAVRASLQRRISSSCTGAFRTDH